MKKNLLLSPDAETQGNGNETAAPKRIDGITAKMSVWSDPEKQGNTERVTLNAVYAEQGVNKSWATSTPSGSLTLGIDNPSAQGFFAKGKEYIVTIREAQPGE
jgi:hypothetical protein